MMLNVILSTLVLFEELAVICLILPWMPTKKFINIFSVLKIWGFPQKLTFPLYFMMLAVFIILTLIGLELHYLQVNETLLSNFDEFKSNLFTLMKLFIVLHRLLYLLSSESSLRDICYALKHRLKIEQGEEVDFGEILEKPLGGTKDKDYEISNLRAELERSQLELEAMKEAYIKLQLKLQRT